MDLIGLPAAVREQLAPAGRAIYASALAKHVDKGDLVAHAWAWAAVEKAGMLPETRELEPIDAETSKTPFPHKHGKLGEIREDQVPRFFGTLTDSDALPLKTVRLDQLTALQNRVSTGKVQAIRDKGGVGKPAVVVNLDGSNYIADGHHRLTADWLDGKETAEVRYKDLTPVSNVMKRAAVIAKDCPDSGDVHVDGPLSALVNATKPKKKRSALESLVKAAEAAPDARSAVRVVRAAIAETVAQSASERGGASIWKAALGWLRPRLRYCGKE